MSNVQTYYNPDRAPDRRKRPQGRPSKTWKCVELQGIHHIIVRELIKGKSNRAIAKEYNISEVMVSNVKNSPAVQARLDVLNAVADGVAVDVRKEIIRQAPKALEVLNTLMNGEATTPHLKAKIAMDHLDRAGFAPIKQIESKNLHAHRYIDEEDIKGLKKRAMELAASNNLLQGG